MGLITRKSRSYGVVAAALGLVFSANTRAVVNCVFTQTTEHCLEKAGERIRAGDVVSAGSILESLVARLPDMPQHLWLGTQLGRGRVKRWNRDLDESEAIYLSISSRIPENSEAMVGLALIALEKKQFARADELLKSAVSIGATNEEARLARRWIDEAVRYRLNFIANSTHRADTTIRDAAITLTVDVDHQFRVVGAISQRDSASPLALAGETLASTGQSFEGTVIYQPRKLDIFSGTLRSSQISQEGGRFQTASLRWSRQLNADLSAELTGEHTFGSNLSATSAAISATYKVKSRPSRMAALTLRPQIRWIDDGLSTKVLFGLETLANLTSHFDVGLSAQGEHSVANDTGDTSTSGRGGFVVRWQAHPKWAITTRGSRDFRGNEYSFGGTVEYSGR